ncbi:MAG: cadmium resistance transporter [Pelatocladus maniniholoensis HA4357-MV3]|jgi:cadmium resistance transport/sequestration family protein|uniref:Cadmium resistance transporter n=1 Tax=Pelatocladus maniniholoensis HA4357-MV3 TaxID=1117104 RepID=A0A9E3H8Q6_9NOST|nr:cadmium resistance transporter [Pelatocladus maniniholoensis HA4357-MV3]BAZ66818.1 cadmium resistance transporter [Fischerella sp. NIES-4106]
MSEFIPTLLVGISAFIATNIDDIVILLILFSQTDSSFRCRHIIAGQYLGFTVLLIASLPGLFSGSVIAPHWLGLLGLIPIAMGISSLINQEENISEEIAITHVDDKNSDTANFFNPHTYSVAAITIANGSDNISVYVPLFASGSLNNFIIIVIVFFLLIAIWCYLAYKFTSYSQIANILSKYGNYIFPIVLIGIGSYLLLKNQSLSLFKLAVSCFCLVIILNKNK